MFMEGERLRAEFGEETVADLSIGQPLEAPESVVEAFAAASRERFVGRFGYMPNLGYPDVRERAAEDVDFPTARPRRRDSCRCRQGQTCVSTSTPSAERFPRTQLR
jgi:aspartate aminotransferase